jgi:hypothetical protein
MGLNMKKLCKSIWGMGASQPGNKTFLGIPLGFFFAIVLFEWLTILFLNKGVFTYSLDDAYIHLSLAQNIFEGHYGINPGEYSAPSSSIIWPFLLAVFAQSTVFEYIPLIINTLISAGILIVAGLLCRRIFITLPYGRMLTVLVVTLLIIGGNLVGLVFTGMEHSLQVLVALLMVAGLMSWCRDSYCPRYLMIFIIAAPLIRYEMLALSLPAVWILWRTGKTRPAIVSLVCLAMLMVGFAFFLHSIGQGFFPNSVAAKSEIISKSSPLLRITQNIMSGILEKRGRGVFLFCMLCGFLIFRFDKRSNQSIRLMSEWVVLAIGLHFCFGQFGWFSRYEIYIWVSSMLTMLFVLTERFEPALRGVAPWIPAVAVLFFFSTTSLAYLYAMVMTPVAANNIYEQQYQTRRFITEFYKRSVAVNDIGLPTFEQDLYVLDIWGLASKRALDYRTAQAPAVWMDDLAKEHDIALAVIYDTEYKPKNWIPLASWSLSRRRITPSSATVSIFSIDPTHIDEQMLLLQAFKETLPDGVKWVWLRQPGQHM